MYNAMVADKKTVDASILDSDAGIVGHSDLKNKTNCWDEFDEVE